MEFIDVHVDFQLNKKKLIKKLITSKKKVSFKDMKKYMSNDKIENNPLKDILKGIKIN